MRHGTLDRYQAGCRCSACVLAAARADEQRERPLPPRRQPRLTLLRRAVVSHERRSGELAVQCWCQAAIVYVDPAVVRACRTESCGLPGCTEGRAA